MKDIKMNGVTHTCGADGRYGAVKADDLIVKADR